MDSAKTCIDVFVSVTLFLTQVSVKFMLEVGSQSKDVDFGYDNFSRMFSDTRTVHKFACFNSFTFSFSFNYI